MKPVLFRGAALLDLENAYDWYDGQSAGLGARFERAVRAAVTAVQERPRHFRKWRGSLRRAMTKRFPYAIFYAEQAERIVIVAVFHAKRSRAAVWRRFRDGD